MQHILTRTCLSNENETIKKVLRSSYCLTNSNQSKSVDEASLIKTVKRELHDNSENFGGLSKNKLKSSLLADEASLKVDVSNKLQRIWNLRARSPYNTIKKTFSDSTNDREVKANYPQYSYEIPLEFAALEKTMNGLNAETGFHEGVRFSQSGNVFVTKMHPKDASDYVATPKKTKFEKKVKKSSQYDEFLLLEKMNELQLNQEMDAKMFALLKTFIDKPLNSFVSVYGAAKPHLAHQENETAKDTPPAAPSKHFLDTESLQNYVTGMLNPKKEVIIQKKSKSIVHRADVSVRTRHLIKSIKDASSIESRNKNIVNLKDHLLNFPFSRITAINEDAIPVLRKVQKEMKRIMKERNEKNETNNTLMMTLAMLGHVEPPKGRGLRILALDGGGCRGAATVQMLKRLSDICGQPIHLLFDYIAGVSTGALLTYLLAIKQYDMEDLTPLYRNFGTKIFERSRIGGVGNLFMTHAYYNTENYIQCLRDVLGDEVLIESATRENTPKCCAVSALVNRMSIKPYIWRNYSLVPGTRHSHWAGTCRAKIWEAARASSAAPGYFEEFFRAGNIHQDGAMFSNNPTGIALNECRVLWPDIPLHCVVSVGSGRYEPSVGPTMDQLSLREKFMKVVDGATNVSGVHSLIYDLLPKGTYFRFDPHMREPVMIDDYEQKKINMLLEDTDAYINKNDLKFHACAGRLMELDAEFATSPPLGGIVRP